MKNRLIKAVRTANHDQLAACGAAAGIGNRSRSIPSGKDKVRCSRFQRRAFKAGRWE